MAACLDFIEASLREKQTDRVSLSCHALGNAPPSAYRGARDRFVTPPCSDPGDCATGGKSVRSTKSVPPLFDPWLHLGRKGKREAGRMTAGVAPAVVIPCCAPSSSLGFFVFCLLFLSLGIPSVRKESLPLSPSYTKLGRRESPSDVNEQQEGHRRELPTFRFFFSESSAPFVSFGRRSSRLTERGSRISDRTLEAPVVGRLF